MHNGRLEVRLDTSLESLLDHAPRDGTPSVLATLVGSAGSTYRKPGARMLIMADGRYVGLLSGGCLEADLGLHAREVLLSGATRAIEYDMRGPDDILFGIGAGCEGAMRILLEPLGKGSVAGAALAAAAAASRTGRAATLVAIHESADVPLGTYDPATLAALAAPALLAATSRAMQEAASCPVEFDAERGRTRALVQFVAPAPHLVICGAGPDAVPVAMTALSLGWRVAVVDHRPAYALAERFPGADVRLAPPDTLRATVDLDHCHAAVVMSHHLPSDVAYLRELGMTPAPGYVGLLGPPARRQRIAHELGASAAALRTRIHGPVGIDIGAATPEGIALAIIAEIHAWLAGRNAAPHHPESLPSTGE